MNSLPHKDIILLIALRNPKCPRLKQIATGYKEKIISQNLVNYHLRAITQPANTPLLPLATTCILCFEEIHYNFLYNLYGYDKPANLLRAINLAQTYLTKDQLTNLLLELTL